MSRQKNQISQFYSYMLSVVSWEVGYSSNGQSDYASNESFDLALDVELSEPINFCLFIWRKVLFQSVLTVN